MKAIIPARGGSKAILDKNIKLMCDKPLIYYSIMACILSESITQVVVSTDSAKIQDSVEPFEKFGVRVLERPSQLARDDSPDLEFLDHYFEWEDGEEVALIRPTSPLRNPKVIDLGIQHYFKHKNSCTGMRSASALSQPAHKMFKMQDGYFKGFFEDFNGDKEYSNLPRQMFPKTYLPNGYVDIVKRSTIEDGDSSFGTEILSFETEYLLDIDDQSDFDLLESHLVHKSHMLLDALCEREL